MFKFKLKRELKISGAEIGKVQPNEKWQFQSFKVYLFSKIGMLGENLEVYGGDFLLSSKQYTSHKKLKGVL